MNKKSKNILSAILCIVMIISGFGIPHIKVYAESQLAYFGIATAVKYAGNSGGPFSETHSQWKTLKYVGYDNETVDSSKYVVFENCVISESKRYDLVIYPFKGTSNAQVIITNGYHDKTPVIRCPCGMYNGYQLIITEHGDMNKPVNMNIYFGFSDLDNKEYVIVPSTFSQIHKGEKIEPTNSDGGEHVETPIDGIKYRGISDAGNDKTAFDTNCVMGVINVPTSGITIYFGIDKPFVDYSTNHCARVSLAFDKIKDYIEPNGYTIEFNENGGSGPIPTPIMKYGSDTSTVMGDIGSTVPTRSGYVFRGWSASPSFNSKRIAYSSSSGGSAASDGTTATTTSSSWSYATYCSNTGGDSSNRTLTLYAQWEYAPSYTHTLAYNANGGSGAPASSTVTNTSSTYNMTVSSTQPTRTGYTFAGWNTNSSETGTDYSAGGSVSVGANATVTLYAKWTANNYTVTYIDRISGTTTNLGSSTAAKPYGSTVRGADKGSNTAAGAYYAGYYYVSDTSTTVDTNGATVYRYFSPANYTVTYIDVVKETGKVLGRATDSKPYGSSVQGIDRGASTADNAYYKNYALIAGTDGYTTATVDTSNNTVVYRYFRWLTTDISGTVNWTDNHNAYETRPDKVKIVIFQNGAAVTSVTTVSGTKNVEPVILSTSGDVNNFDFSDMPVYDSAGNPYTYDVRMYDLDVAADIKNPSSVMSLEYPESKYVTTQNGYDIYNKLDNYIPGEQDVPEGFTVNGAIHWVDSGNKLGLRPSTVTIELYQDGEPFIVNGKQSSITVDAFNDNTYKFTKLPKYKYVDGEPVPYEYTAVEIIVSNYVKDGVIYPLYDIHTDENMGEYEKLHFTNYIKIDGPIIPIIPKDQRDNTITVITNTEDKVDIVLKMLDFYITETPEDVNVQYGPGYNGDEYNLSVSELGEIIKHLPSGKYEIDVNESKYELKDIHISDNTDNVYITYEDGKYYLVIDHVPGDSWGTVNIELEKKTEYYQSRKAINNYFKAPFAKRIVGGYIELPEDRDVSVVEKLMMCNYFIEAVTEPVNPNLPEKKEATEEEITETDTSEIEDTEEEQDIEDTEDEQDIEDKQDTEESEDESEEESSSIEDSENDSSEM